MSPELKLDVSPNYRPWTAITFYFKTHKKNNKHYSKITDISKNKQK
jgi:hypothetical protein